jgi:hypothetical protein
MGARAVRRGLHEERTSKEGLRQLTMTANPLMVIYRGNDASRIKLMP